MFPTMSVGKGWISLIWPTLFILSTLTNHGNCQEAQKEVAEQCQNIKCSTPPAKYTCGKCRRPHPRAEKYLGSLADCCPHWCCTDRNRRKILFVGVANKKMKDWDFKRIQQSKTELDCWNVTCPVSTPVTVSCKVDPKPPESFQLLNPDHAHCCPTLDCRTLADNSTVKSFRLIEGNMPADPPSIREEKGVAEEGKLCPKIQCMERPTPPPDGKCEELVIPVESGLSPQEMEIINEFHECCPKMWQCSNKEGLPHLIYGVSGPSFKYYSTIMFNDTIEKGPGHCKNVTCRPPAMDQCSILRHPSSEILKFAKDKIDCCPVYNCSGADGWNAVGFSSIEGVLPEPEPGNVTSDKDCEFITCGSRPTGIEASCTPTERKTSVSRSLGKIRACCNSWECLYSNNTIYNYYQITGNGFIFREIQTNQHDSSDYLVLLVDKKDQIHNKRITLATMEPTTSGTLLIDSDNATTGSGNTTEDDWFANATIINRNKPESKKIERIVKYYVAGNGTVPAKLVEEKTFSNVTCIRFLKRKTIVEQPAPVTKLPPLKNGTSKPFIMERIIVVHENGTEVEGKWRNITITTAKPPSKATPRKVIPPKKVPPKKKAPPKVAPKAKVAPKPKVPPKLPPRSKIPPKLKVTPRSKVTPPRKVTPKMKVTPRPNVTSTANMTTPTNANTTAAATTESEYHWSDDFTNPSELSEDSESDEVTSSSVFKTRNRIPIFSRSNATTEWEWELQQVRVTTQSGLKKAVGASTVSGVNPAFEDVTVIPSENLIGHSANPGDDKMTSQSSHEDDSPSGTTPAYHADNLTGSSNKERMKQDGRRLEGREPDTIESVGTTTQSEVTPPSKVGSTVKGTAHPYMHTTTAKLSETNASSGMTPSIESLKTSTEKTESITSHGGTEREAPSGAPKHDQIQSTSATSKGEKGNKQYGRKYEDGYDDDNTHSSRSGSAKPSHKAATALPSGEDSASDETPSVTGGDDVELSGTTDSSNDPEQFNNEKENSSSDNRSTKYSHNGNALKSKKKHQAGAFDGMISNRNSKGSQYKGNNVFPMNQQSGLSEIAKQSEIHQGQNWGNPFQSVLKQDKENSSSTNNTALFFHNHSNASKSNEKNWGSQYGGRFKNGNQQGSGNLQLPNLWAEFPKQSNTNQGLNWGDQIQAARQHIQQMTNDQGSYQKFMTQHLQGMNQNLQFPSMNTFPFPLQGSIFNYNLPNPNANANPKPSGKRADTKKSAPASSNDNSIHSEYSEKMQEDGNRSGKSSRRDKDEMAPAKSGSSNSGKQNSKSESQQQSSKKESFGHIKDWEQQTKQMEKQFSIPPQTFRKTVTKPPESDENDATPSKVNTFEENKSMNSSHPQETVAFSNSAGQGYTGQSSSSSSYSKTFYHHQQHSSSSFGGTKSTNIRQDNEKSDNQSSYQEDHFDDARDLQTPEEEDSEKRSKNQDSGSDKVVQDSGSDKAVQDTESSSVKIGHCESQDYVCPKLKFKGTCSQDNSTESKRFLPENENCCALTLCVDRNIHRTYYVKYIGSIPTDESEIKEEKGIPQGSIQCPNVKCLNDSTVPSYQSCSEAKEAQPRMARVKPFLECCPMLKCLRDDDSYSVELRVTSKSFSYYEIAFYNIKNWNPVETRTIIYESKGEGEKNENENPPPDSSQLASPNGNDINSQNGGGGVPSGQQPSVSGTNSQFNPFMRLQFNPQQLVNDQLGHMQNMFKQPSQFKYSKKSRAHPNNGVGSGDGMPMEEANAHLTSPIKKSKTKRKPKSKTSSAKLDVTYLLN